MKIRDILEAESPGGALSTAQVDTAQDKALPDGNFALGGKVREILKSATNKPLLTQTSNRGVVGPVQKTIWDHVRRGRDWADGLMQSVHRALPNEQQQKAAYDYFMAANKAWHMANQASMGESLSTTPTDNSWPSKGWVADLQALIMKVYKQDPKLAEGIVKMINLIINDGKKRLQQGQQPQQVPAKPQTVTVHRDNESNYVDPRNTVHPRYGEAAKGGRGHWQ